jgi:ribose 5-phosphate isomerase A
MRGAIPDKHEVGLARYPGVGPGRRGRTRINEVMTATADRDQRKREAARRALELVRPGMKLGLGSGTTARQFVDLVGERVKDGLDIICVGTSKATEEQAKNLGIPLSTLDDLPELDLTVDGADEVDPELRLIKGGGGALLREKIVAAASKRMAVIVDSSKLVRALGAFPLPIEVVPFGLAATRGHIERALAGLNLVGQIRLRGGSTPFVTDGGHYILDCSLGAIDQPERLSESLAMIPGVVEHGLFIGLARVAIVAGAEGVQVIGDPDGSSKPLP